MRFLFRKKEKLTAEKDIDLLFKSGKSSFIYPVKVIFITNTIQQSECKVLMTAPKRYLKKAVDRNLVKRRLREAYRLNSIDLKNTLVEKNVSATIAFIYVSSKIINFNDLEAIVIKQIAKIISILEKSEKES